MSSSYLNQEDSINKDWFVDSFPEEDNEEDVDELDDILNEVIPTDDKLDHNLSVIKTENISSSIKTLLKKEEEFNILNTIIDHKRLLPEITSEALTNSEIEKDSNQNIIDKGHITSPYLNKYEKTAIISERSLLLSQGYIPFIEQNKLDPSWNYIQIAEEELKQKLIPIIIIRKLPSGVNEYWKLQDMIILS